MTVAIMKLDKVALLVPNHPQWKSTICQNPPVFDQPLFIVVIWQFQNPFKLGCYKKKKYLTKYLSVSFN